MSADPELPWAERIGREQQHFRNYYRDSFGKELSPETDPYDHLHISPLSMHRTQFAPSFSSWARKQVRIAEQLLEDEGATEAQSCRTPLPQTGVSAAPRTSISIRSSSSRGAPVGGEEQASEEQLLAGTLSPARTPALSRHSASAPQLQSGTASRQPTSVSLGRSSRRSIRSSLSVASLRSKIEEAVQRELKRTALSDYNSAIEARKKREREKILKMPIALRPSPGPLYMGCPPTSETTYMAGSTGPIKMATDPKWSTDLKRINGRVGQRLEFERKLSGSVTGAVIPELYHMPPKEHLSNPPTPYFKPGEAGKRRAA